MTLLYSVCTIGGRILFSVQTFGIVLGLIRSLQDPSNVLKGSKGCVNIGNKLIARKILDCTLLQINAIYTGSFWILQIRIVHFIRC